MKNDILLCANAEMMEIENPNKAGQGIPRQISTITPKGINRISRFTEGTKTTPKTEWEKSLPLIQIA